MDVRRELRDQLVAACNRKHPWSAQAFVRTVGEIEHHDVVSSGILADEIRDKNPREWTKHALITLEEVMDGNMVEVIAESHCYKQQLISCRFSTCLLLWEGKEVGCSRNSPTCSWP